MPSAITPLDEFPLLTPEHILAFQFSSWYPRFSSHSIKSTIIRPLSEEFREYLDSEGVSIPEGAEDLLVVSLHKLWIIVLSRNERVLILGVDLLKAHYLIMRTVMTTTMRTSREGRNMLSQN